MTREEAWNEIDAIIGKHEIDDEYVTITREQGYEALRVAREAMDMAIKSLEQEPCEDVPDINVGDIISRQAVLALAKEECDTAIIPYRRFVKDINALPPVNPQPKIGHWIKMPIGFKCSECNVLEYISTKFCSNCGAKMIEPQESEET